MNKFNINIQSRGIKQHYDYNWKNIDNSYSENSEKLFNQLVELINVESNSILVVYFENKYYLLITEISANVNETFANTIIRLNILISCSDEHEIRKIVSVYLKFKSEFEQIIVNELDYSKDDYSINYHIYESIQKFVDSKFTLQTEHDYDLNSNNFILTDDNEQNRNKLSKFLIVNKLPKSNNLNPIFIITDKIYKSKEINERKIKLGIIRIDDITNKSINKPKMFIIIIILLVLLSILILFGFLYHII